MKRSPYWVASTSVLALLFAMTSIAEAETSGAAPPSADIDPANFVSQVTNEFFPLQPGTTLVYTGMKDGEPTSDRVFVTHETKQILGVTCTVVRDLAFEDGVLAENTIDWYAQDVDGNVWYFGEATKELDADGNVISTEGSWEAGVDGARPGIIMEAHPQAGDRYYQEFALHVAEDQARVLRLGGSQCVPYGCLGNLLVTREWTRLSPDEVELKTYARGVGFIRGVIVKGGNERTALVRIITGNGASPAR